jgi:hypothetical protein
MSNINLRNITNSFLDVRLASLASWRQANEFIPRDRAGPYVVTQEGYDPEDPTMTPDEFVLGRSGKWLSLAHFFRMPVPDRRAEFIFGTMAEVMEVMSALPSRATIMRPAGRTAGSPLPAETDEMAAAFRAGRSQSPGTAP